MACQSQPAASSSTRAANRPPQWPEHGGNQFLVESELPTTLAAGSGEIAAHLDLQQLLADYLRDGVDARGQHLSESAHGRGEVQVQVAAVQVAPPLPAQARRPLAVRPWLPWPFLSK